MKKKQILKEQKRLKQERREVSSLFQSDKEVYKVFKVLFGVIAFIGLAFVLINIFNGNWNIFTKNNVKQEEIDSRMVIVGTMFNKEKDKEYLVLGYDLDDEKHAFYSALAGYYQGSKNLYYLDLGSGFNSSIIGEKMNITNKLDKLTVNGPFLLVIKNDQIVSSYTSEKQITDYIMNEK